MVKKNTYDLEGCAEKLGIEPAMLKKLLLKSIPGFLSEVALLKTAASQNDFTSLQVTAHKLKGSSGNYLLDTAYECAAAISEKSEALHEYDYDEKITEIENYLTDVKNTLEVESVDG